MRARILNTSLFAFLGAAVALSGCTTATKIPAALNPLSGSANPLGGGKATTLVEAKSRIKSIISNLNNANKKFVSATDRVSRAAGLKKDEILKSACDAKIKELAANSSEVVDTGKCKDDYGIAAKAAAEKLKKYENEDARLPRLNVTHIALAAKDLWDMNRYDKAVLSDATSLVASLSSSSLSISSVKEASSSTKGMGKILEDAKEAASSTKDRITSVPDFIKALASYATKFGLIDDVIEYMVKMPTMKGGTGDYEGLVEIFKAVKELNKSK